jgi:beta-galactosidase
VTEWRDRRILFGGDYNPDQWDRATWDEDLRLMEHFRVNTVTMPVFAWGRLQPAEDRFEFDWLDEVVEGLSRRGISIIMATPTMAQPAWMFRRYPEVANVDVQGRRRVFGGRAHFCPNSPVYRRFSRGIAAALAERYRDRKNLILWHVSNEYGTPCYCDRCAAAFREWLKARYGTLEELNRRWSTAFWGHTLHDWEEVVVPSELSELLPGGLGDRPASFFQPITIDYHRFISDSLRACYRNEAEAIRQAMPGVPITTNMMGAFWWIDYFSWADDLDVVAWDSYPHASDGPDWSAFRHSLMRGLKRRPFLLMEQTPNQQNWQPYNTLKRPGEVRLLTYQALAHGSDSALFFQWRQSLGAFEKYHGAMVPHAGHERTRIGGELRVLGEELARLEGTFTGAPVRASCALIFDWPAWWAVDYSSGPSQALRYLPQVEKWFRAFHDQNLSLDVVRPSQDLSGYTLVVAPALVMVDATARDRLRSYVAGGGVLLTSFFTGWVDENDRVIPGAYPGALRDVLGIWVEEIDALAPGQKNRLRIDRRRLPTRQASYPCGLVCEVVHLEGARALATYGADYYAGSPAVTEHRFGQGRAIHVATDPAAPFLAELVRHQTRAAGVAPSVRAGRGVEAVVRATERSEYLFLLNHAPRAAEVRLGAAGGTDLITGRKLRGLVRLPPRGVAIVERPVRPAKG